MAQFIHFVVFSFAITYAGGCVATGGTTTTTIAPTACSTCTTNQLILTTGNDADTPSMLTAGVDANGCATVTIVCQATPVDADDAILITFYSDTTNPRDVGVQNGVGTSTAMLTCVNNHWQQGGIEIDEVECQVIP